MKKLIQKEKVFIFDNSKKSLAGNPISTIKKKK